MSRSLLLVLALLLTVPVSAEQTRKRTTLDFYVVDTEGGKAMLVVTPAGEAVLVDTGHPGGRDTDRIMAAIDDAGLTELQHVLLTHYHLDHVGGLAELATRIPILHYLDHGPSIEEREQVPGFQSVYADLRSRAKHTVVKAGDRLALSGADWRIVMSDAQPIKSALTGTGTRNPACAQLQKRDVSIMPDERTRSVGSVITFGEFRAVDLGDLLWNEEALLMCPNNPIGTVDLYLVSHHGQSASGSPALVHGLQPRVAVMQNGTRKGAAPSAMHIIRSSPGLEDIWQLHWSYSAGVEQNSAGVFIANIEDPATLASSLTSTTAPRSGEGASTHPMAYWIKISAQSDGTFTVLNGRNQFSKTYRPR